MIYLYELINPMYRDISLEDHGHPFFIINAPVYEPESIAPSTSLSTKVKFQRLIEKFETMDQLADYVISWDTNNEPYKNALLNELTKEV